MELTTSSEITQVDLRVGCMNWCYKSMHHHNFTPVCQLSPEYLANNIV